jgi:hypothetical protein
MARTTLTLPDDLLRRAKQAAVDRDVSMAQLIRSALEEALSERPRSFSSAGVFESGRTDIAKKSGAMKFEPRSWR